VGGAAREATTNLKIHTGQERTVSGRTIRYADPAPRRFASQDSCSLARAWR